MVEPDHNTEQLQQGYVDAGFQLSASANARVIERVALPLKKRERGDQTAALEALKSEAVGLQRPIVVTPRGVDGEDLAQAAAQERWYLDAGFERRNLDAKPGKSELVYTPPERESERSSEPDPHAAESLEPAVGDSPDSQVLAARLAEDPMERRVGAASVTSRRWIGRRASELGRVAAGLSPEALEKTVSETEAALASARPFDELASKWHKTQERRAQRQVALLGERRRREPAMKDGHAQQTNSELPGLDPWVKMPDRFRMRLEPGAVATFEAESGRLRRALEGKSDAELAQLSEREGVGRDDAFALLSGDRDEILARAAAAERELAARAQIDAIAKGTVGEPAARAQPSVNRNVEEVKETLWGALGPERGGALLGQAKELLPQHRAIATPALAQWAESLGDPLAGFDAERARNLRRGEHFARVKHAHELDERSKARHDRDEAKRLAKSGEREQKRAREDSATAHHREALALGAQAEAADTRLEVLGHEFEGPEAWLRANSDRVARWMAARTVLDQERASEQVRTPEASVVEGRVPALDARVAELAGVGRD